MAKKKLRKGSQLSLINPKNTGRPAFHDKGICHRKREHDRASKTIAPHD